jgi:hypothetical protein
LDAHAGMVHNEFVTRSRARGHRNSGTAPGPYPRHQGPGHRSTKRYSSPENKAPSSANTSLLRYRRGRPVPAVLRGDHLGRYDARTFPRSRHGRACTAGESAKHERPRCAPTDGRCTWREGCAARCTARAEARCRKCVSQVRKSPLRTLLLPMSLSSRDAREGLHRRQFPLLPAK